MSLPYIQPKNALWRENKKQKIIGTIIDRLNGIVCEGQKKDNLEYILLVCSLVEHLVSKKDKLQKKDLVIEVFQSMYPEFSQEEKQQLDKHIEFLWENGRIKKVSCFRQIVANVFSWVERKIL